ncbi:MAG: hypothetical protein RI907_3195, partial [Pseudomonadota bacterium]
QAEGAKALAPTVAELHDRADALLLAHGFQPAAEPPLTLRFLQKHGAYRAPGCPRALWLFSEPLPENTPQYFNSQGRGDHVFRFYYEGVASAFPNGLVRQWTGYRLKLQHVLGLGPKPAGHFLLLAVPAECAGAEVDLRPAYQRR